MKFRILLIPIILGALYLSVIGYYAYQDEMHTQQEDSSLFLLNLGCIFLFFLMALAFLVASISMMIKRQWSIAGVLLLAVATSASIPVIRPFVSEPLSRSAQIRYIDRFGRENLREAAALLMPYANNQKYPLTYLGRDIPPEECPQILVDFARGQGFEVSEYGVTFRTHGLGSWRGGYLIVPINSTIEPEFSSQRKIIDGFYRVTSS